MSLLNNLASDAQARLNARQQESKNLVESWEKGTPLLEGLTSGDKRMMARLLDNQLKQLMQESNATNPGGPNSEEWSGVALPLVRRVFTDMAAKDFVSIQTMNQPSGLVFYLDFKFGSESENGGIFTGHIHGNTSSSGAPVGGYYGDGRFGYSINDREATIVVGAVSCSSASYADVNYRNELSASVAAGEICKFDFPITGLTRPDKAGIYGWRITGSGLTANDNLPFFTTLLNSDGNPIYVTDVVSDTSAVSVSVFVTGTFAAQATHIFYNEQTDASNRGDFEDRDSSATDLEIPTIDVQLRSEPIVAKTRKLKAVWSTEYAQDLNAYHNIDAEAEISDTLSQIMTTEIDLEILAMLMQAGQSTNVEHWSAYIGQVYVGNGTDESAWAEDGAGGQARAETQGSWFSTLGTKVQKLSNQIHSKTMRGGANFLVCSPEVATILESIPGYAADTDGSAMTFGMGLQRVGALANRFTVYKNPYMQGNAKNTILLGFRGSQFLETGAVYAPYIPMITSPVVLDPNNFTPRKSIHTRYAKRVIRPEFYGVIKVKDLSVV